MAIVTAVISPPMVPKGNICKELKVYPAECRGRRSTYRGKLTVSNSVKQLNDASTCLRKPKGLKTADIFWKWIVVIWQIR